MTTTMTTKARYAEVRPTTMYLAVWDNGTAEITPRPPIRHGRVVGCEDKKLVCEPSRQLAPGDEDTSHDIPVWSGGNSAVKDSGGRPVTTCWPADYARPGEITGYTRPPEFAERQARIQAAVADGYRRAVSAAFEEIAYEVAERID